MWLAPYDVTELSKFHNPSFRASNSLRRLLGCAIVIFASEEFLKKSYRSIALQHEVRDISVMTPILLKVRSVLINVKKEHRPPRKWRPVAKARLARTGT